MSCGVVDDIVIITFIGASSEKIMSSAPMLLLSSFSILRQQWFLHTYSIPEGGTGDRIS